MASKLWETMNDLEMTTAKICSAREIIDAAINRLQEHQYDKAETMMCAAYEFLEYYLNEFDEKFKLAWQETVVKQKKEEDDAWDSVNGEREYYEPSMPPWGHSDMEYLSQYSGSTVSSVQYTDEELNAMCDKAAEDEKKTLNYNEAVAAGWEMTGDGIWMPPHKEDKVKKWVLPVQYVNYYDAENYYVNFPDDLLEAANLKEGDQVEWVDQGDGSYLLKKVEK